MESEDPLSEVEPPVKMEENEGWEPSLLILLPEFHGGDDDDDDEQEEERSSVREGQGFDTEEDVFVMEEGNNEVWTEEPPVAAQLPSAVVKSELGEANEPGAGTWGDHLGALNALNTFVGGIGDSEDANQWNCSQKLGDEPLNLSYARNVEPVDATFVETAGVSRENQIHDGGGGSTNLMMQDDARSDVSVLPMIVSTMSLSGVHRALKAEEIPPSARGVFPCSCGQLYVHRSSLYKHVQRKALKNRGGVSKRGRRVGAGVGSRNTKNQKDSAYNFVSGDNRQKVPVSGKLTANSVTKEKFVLNRTQHGQSSRSVNTGGNMIETIDLNCSDDEKEMRDSGGGKSSNTMSSLSVSEKRGLQVVHRSFNNSMAPSADGLFYCCCGKSYGYYSSLRRHIRLNSKNKKAAAGAASLKRKKMPMTTMTMIQNPANGVGQTNKKSSPTKSHPTPSAEKPIIIHRNSENKETKEKAIPVQVSNQRNLQMREPERKVDNEKQNQSQENGVSARTNMATLDDILDFFETGISLKKFGPTLGMEGFQCFCGKVFSQLSGIMGHVHASSKVDPWHCLMSGKLMRKRKMIAQQMKLKRNAKKPFLKVKTLAPQMQMSSTEKKLYPKSHRCMLCGKRFSYLRCLRNHQLQCEKRKVAAKLQPYTCSLCDRSFPEYSHLRSHERVHENQEKREKELNHKRTSLSMNCSTQISEPNSMNSSSFPILSSYLTSGNSRGEATSMLNSTSVGDSILSSTANKVRKVICKPPPPYTCSVCSRTFPEYAHLRSHERCHMNKLKKENELNLKGRAGDANISIKDILKSNLINSDDSQNLSKSLSVNSNSISTSKLNSTSVGDSLISSTGNNGKKVVSKPPPPYTCSLCNKTFPEYAHLRSHERFHVNQLKKENELRLKGKSGNTDVMIKEILKQNSMNCGVSRDLSINSNAVPTSELNSVRVGDTVITFAANNGKKAVCKPLPPYTCSVCDRTFPEYAHLRSHERCHMNKLKKRNALNLKGRSGNANITINDVSKPNSLNCDDSPKLSDSTSLGDSVNSPAANIVTKLRLFRKKEMSSQGLDPESCENGNGVWMLGASDAATSEQLDEDLTKANAGSSNCGEKVVEENNVTQGSDANTNIAQISAERKSSRKSSLSKSNSGDFLCICGVVMKSSSETSKHIEDHLSRKEFCCHVCGKLFIQKILFEKHIRFHEKRKSFKCIYCHQTFRFYIDFAVHRLGHDGKFETCCITCGRKIKMRDAPPFDTMSFCCYVCRKRMDGPSVKAPPARKEVEGDSTSDNPEKREEGAIEMIARPATCDICQKYFENFEELTHHWQSHFGDCTVTLNRIERIPEKVMTESRIETNGDSSPIEVSVAATSALALEENIGSEKQGEVDGGAVVKKKRKSKKRFFCECGRGFAYTSTLKKHLCVFTCKHQCQSCDRLFRNDKAFRSHLQFHSGLPRHQCNICLQRFVRLQQLLVHKKKVHLNNASVDVQITDEKVEGQTKVSKEGENCVESNDVEEICENSEGQLKMMNSVEKTSEGNVAMKESNCEQNGLQMISSIVNESDEQKLDNQMEVALNLQELSVEKEEKKRFEKDDDKMVEICEKDKGQDIKDGHDKREEKAEDCIDKSCSGNSMKKDSIKDTTLESPGIRMLENHIEEIPEKSKEDKETNGDLSGSVESATFSNVAIAEETMDNRKFKNVRYVRKRKVERYFCRCGRGFTCRTSRDMHKCEFMMKHQCKICQKRFRKKNHLTEHTRLHLGLPRYQCNICKQRFVRVRELDIHRKKGHRGKLLSIKPTVGEQMADKKFNNQLNVTEEEENCVESNDVEVICENDRRQLIAVDLVEETSEGNIAMKEADCEQKELEMITSVANNTDEQKLDNEMEVTLNTPEISVDKEEKKSCQEESNNEIMQICEKDKGQPNTEEDIKVVCDKILENEGDCVNKSLPSNDLMKGGASISILTSCEEEVCDVKNEPDICDREISEESSKLEQNVTIDIPVVDEQVGSSMNSGEESGDETFDAVRGYKIIVGGEHHEGIVDTEIEHADEQNSLKRMENKVVGEQLNSNIKKEGNIEVDSCLDGELRNEQELLPSEVPNNASVEEILFCETMKSPIASEELEKHFEVKRERIESHLQEEFKSKNILPPSEVPENSVVKEEPKCDTVLTLDDDQKVSAADGHPENEDPPPSKKRKNSMSMECGSVVTLDDDDDDEHSNNVDLPPCKKHKSSMENEEHKCDSVMTEDDKNNEDFVCVSPADREPTKDCTKIGGVEESLKDKKVAIEEKIGRSFHSASTRPDISAAGEDMDSSIEDVDEVFCGVCHKAFANSESLEVHKHVWGNIPCNLSQLGAVPQRRMPELRRKDCKGKGVRGRTSKGSESNNFIAESPVFNMKPTSQLGIEKSEQLIPVLKQSFSKERYLSRSVKKNYKCMVCSESFSCPHDLKVHRRRCRRLVTNSLIGQESDANSDPIMGGLEVDLNQLQVVREVTSNKTSLVGGRKLVTNARQIVTGQSVLVNHVPSQALVVDGHKFITNTEQMVIGRDVHTNPMTVVAKTEAGVSLSECNVNQEPQVGSNVLGMAQMPVVIYQPVIVPTIVPMLMSGPIVCGNTNYPKS